MSQKNTINFQTSISEVEVYTLNELKEKLKEFENLPKK